MAGISSKAAGKGLDCGCANKKGYNGNEIQAKEFSDGSGLDVYDFNARTYDQQIGRFIQIDPLTDEGGQESLTPFHFSYNNPSTFSDPDGKCPICPFVPLIVEGIKALAAATIAYIAANEAAPVITDAILNSEAPSIPAASGRSISNNSFAWDPSYVNQLRMSKTDQNKSQVEAKEKPTPTFDGQQDTESATPREALRKAKEQNGIPRSQQPDRTIKPNTAEWDNAQLDNRNVKQYEYTNSKGQKVVIRLDKAATYPTGPPQPPHFNAGQNPQTPKEASQHHNINLPFSSFINRNRN